MHLLAWHKGGGADRWNVGATSEQREKRERKKWVSHGAHGAAPPPPPCHLSSGVLPHHDNVSWAGRSHTRAQADTVLVVVVMGVVVGSGGWGVAHCHCRACVLVVAGDCQACLRLRARRQPYVNQQLAKPSLKRAATAGGGMPLADFEPSLAVARCKQGREV